MSSLIRVVADVRFDSVIMKKKRANCNRRALESGIDEPLPSFWQKLPQVAWKVDGVRVMISLYLSTEDSSERTETPGERR
jgi:hypothetical protein